MSFRSHRCRVIPLRFQLLHQQSPDELRKMLDQLQQYAENQNEYSKSQQIAHTIMRKIEKELRKSEVY